MFLQEVLGKANDIVEWIASLFLHYIYHVLLKTLLRVVEQGLPCASHLLSVLINASH